MIFCQLSAWQKPPFILLPFNLSHTSRPCSSNFSAKHKKQKAQDSSWVNNDKWRGQGAEGLVGGAGEPLGRRSCKTHLPSPSPGPGPCRLDKGERAASAITDVNQPSPRGQTESQREPSSNRSALFHCAIFISVQHLIYYDLLEGLS